MDIKIQSLRFDADKKLIAHIENKVGKLAKVGDKIIGAEVVLRLENSDTKDNKVAEIRILTPNSSDVFAKRQRNTFEESVDLATAALRRQLKKIKEKQRG